MLFTILANFFGGFLLAGIIFVSGGSEEFAIFGAFIIVPIALFLPSVAVMVRRLHDINVPTWVGITVVAFFILTELSLNMEIAVIRLLATVGLGVFLCQKGDEGKNQYGVLEKP